MPNSTNGVIVLSDSFATSIFKQSFLRVFNKDDQGALQMGFNATFDVQVCPLTSCNCHSAYSYSIILDNQGAQGLWPYWPRYLGGEKVGLRW